MASIVNVAHAEPAKLRGVWVATVLNIDWPSAEGLAIDAQKAEFVALLDHYQKLQFNAVFVQIRAAGDALYPSKLAPLARSLSGTEGSTPTEDLLAWMIAQSHQRGIAFHAWMNPYRASMGKGNHANNHISRQRPDWIVDYGGKQYLNPGLPEVRTHLLAVIDEVLQRYPIDGLQFDDYFYPYPEGNSPFDDAEAFKRYAQSGESLGDWRRRNTTQFVYDVKRLVQTRRPKALFGVSPFGVWRNQSKDPRGSATKASRTSYDDLYADVKLWAERGWIDYVAPQIYWSTQHKTANYTALLDWWQNNHGRAHLLIGHAGYKVKNDGDRTWEDPNELPRQIQLARGSAQVAGHLIYNATSLKNRHPQILAEAARAMLGQ
ncbi:MAG: family 10 glycosylhydrolase [Gammaproteobacteria bacterium]|nr:family 10 glycosylhydrolase [Gammaproteobacteria bacterium]